MSLLLRKVKLTMLEQKHKMLGLPDILPSGFHFVRDVPLTSTTWLQIAFDYARREKISLHCQRTIKFVSWTNFSLPGTGKYFSVTNKYSTGVSS